MVLSEGGNFAPKLKIKLFINAQKKTDIPFIPMEKLP